MSNEKVRFEIRLSKDLHRFIGVLSDKLGLPINGIVVLSVALFVKQMIPYFEGFRRQDIIRPLKKMLTEYLTDLDNQL